MGDRRRPLRHGRRLRRRAQRVVDRRLGTRDRATGPGSPRRPSTRWRTAPTGGWRRERVLRQVETSLTRLGVERIDLYLTHEPDPDTPVEETFDTFATLARAWPDRRVGSEQRLRRRPPRVARARHARARAELVLAARPRRRGRGDPALRRARHRVPGVQPARRRLADRQVPPRRGRAGGLADDDAARAVPPPRGRPDLRRRSRRSSGRPRSAGSSPAALALAWALGHGRLPGRRPAPARAPRARARGARPSPCPRPSTRS